MHRIPLVCSVHNTQDGLKIVFDNVTYHSNYKGNIPWFFTCKDSLDLIY